MRIGEIYQFLGVVGRPMKNQQEPISVAKEKLQKNLSDIARICEWADLMGYDDPKSFSQNFLQHHDVRPLKVMISIRLKSIIKYLKSADNNLTNHKIARKHSLPNEKALNSFTKYHLGYSPTEIKSLSQNELNTLLEKFRGRIQG